MPGRRGRWGWRRAPAWRRTSPAIAQIAGRRAPPGSSALHRGEDQPLQRRRIVGHDLAGPGEFAVQDAVEDLDLGLGFRPEGIAPGGELVQRDPRPVHVGPVVDAGLGDLLRGHVAQVALEGAHLACWSSRPRASPSRSRAAWAIPSGVTTMVAGLTSRWTMPRDSPSSSVARCAQSSRIADPGDDAGKMSEVDPSATGARG